MKCTQCGSQDFIRRKGVPIRIGGDAWEIDNPESGIEGFICINCGHVEWYDLVIVKNYKELQTKIELLETYIAETEKEFARHLKQINIINDEISGVNKIIDDDSNTVKVVNEAKDKLKRMQSERLQLEHQFSSVKSKLSDSNKELEDLKKNLIEILRFKE